MNRLRELWRQWCRTWGRLEALAILGWLVLAGVSGCLTTSEKAVVRTVVEIARELCTPEDTLDACVDKLLKDQRYSAAKLTRLANEPDGGQ